MAASPRFLQALSVLAPYHAPAREEAPHLETGIAALDAALPDGGLPRGVVELCGPSGMGRVTSLALRACVAAQAEARANEDHDRSWCAWIDASQSLYAPGLARAGVDLDRLLVVRPEPADVARVAVRLANSRVFSVIVIDRGGLAGAKVGGSNTRWSTVVRRLALAASESDGTILLLSTLEAARRETLPTAMRLELRQPAVDRLSLAVAKDKRGRLRAPQTIPLLAG